MARAQGRRGAPAVAVGLARLDAQGAPARAPLVERGGDALPGRLAAAGVAERGKGAGERSAARRAPGAGERVVGGVHAQPRRRGHLAPGDGGDDGEDDGGEQAGHDAPAAHAARGVERQQELAHRWPAARRIGGQAAHEHRREARLQPRAWRRRRRREHALAQLGDGGVGVGGERVHAEDRLVERDAKGELIGARVGRQVVQLLGRHVARRAGQRAQHRARRGAAVRRATFRRRRDATGDAADERQPEVAHAHAPIVAEQHVRRLEVAMHQPGVVRRRQPAPGEDEAIEARVGRARRLVEPEAQRAPLDELHGHPGQRQRPRRLHARVVHDDDVGVLHARHRLRLGHDVAARRRRRRHQLQRDLAVEARIVGPPHDAHAAMPEHLDEHIAADGAEALRQRRQRRRAALFCGRQSGHCGCGHCLEPTGSRRIVKPCLW